MLTHRLSRVAAAAAGRRHQALRCHEARSYLHRPFCSPSQTPSRREADALCLLWGGALAAGTTFVYRWFLHSPPVSYAELEKQNAETSGAIIRVLRRDPAFLEYAKKVTEGICARDQEDDDKLARGIQLAVDKKVLPASVKLEPIRKIYVEGKSPQEVADTITKALGDAPSKGCVVTLQGLSGTGKGTTVDSLKKQLPNCSTWSNGNIFRSLTLLAVTYAEQNRCTLQEALKPELLASFVKMLEFGEFNGRFDVKIEGLGMKHYVSEIVNTKLQAVAKNIPTVAEVTQGEVVNFVQGALTVMTAAGKNVLVEGREATLNHIRTPHRFELVLRDPNVIGMRRAAQQMGGLAFEEVKVSLLIKNLEQGKTIHFVPERPATYNLQTYNLQPATYKDVTVYDDRNGKGGADEDAIRQALGRALLKLAKQQ